MLCGVGAAHLYLKSSSLQSRLRTSNCKYVVGGPTPGGNVGLECVITSSGAKRCFCRGLYGMPHQPHSPRKEAVLTLTVVTTEHHSREACRPAGWRLPLLGAAALAGLLAAARIVSSVRNCRRRRRALPVVSDALTRRGAFARRRAATRMESRMTASRRCANFDSSQLSALITLDAGCPTGQAQAAAAGAVAQGARPSPRAATPTGVPAAPRRAP